MSAVAETFRLSRRSCIVLSGLFLVLGLAALLAIPSLLHTNVSSVGTRQTLVASTALDALPTSIAKEGAAAEEERGAPDVSAGVRRLKRMTSLDLLVKNPADTTEAIRRLAESMGGYLVSSESGSQDSSYATVTVRIPAARFEEARAQIKKLAAHVNTETVQANDVTRNYVDMQARLRNLRAQEAQYLAIMKRATTVDEVLKVSDKLGEVRGEIEQQQAEFNALSSQVETVAMTVSLRSEAEAQIFGFRWRPLYRVKVAARDALEALGDYASAMTTVILFLPVALLWIVTVAVALLIGWRGLRWVARFFVPSKVAPTAS